MKKVLRYFGQKEELEQQITQIAPDLDFYILHNCLDNAVYFDNIEQDIFYDICESLEQGLYSDKDNSLEQTLVDFLLANNIKISTAESCSGGMVASAIIGISGASEVFHEGLVTYSNLSKENRLGVKKDTLMEFGAVSEQVAQEMAYGLLDQNITLAISTTGIAGPSGGSADKVVGLVYIGLAMDSYPPIAIKNIFSCGRENIRKCTKNAALFYAWQYLNKNL